MPATTTVVINPPTSTVTLVDVEVSPMGVTLCSVHASNVTPPMNWELIDERAGDLRLLPQAAERDVEAEPVEAPPAPAPAPRRTRRRRVAEELFSRVPPPDAGPSTGQQRRTYRDAG